MSISIRQQPLFVRRQVVVDNILEMETPRLNVIPPDDDEDDVGSMLDMAEPTEDCATAATDNDVISENTKKRKALSSLSCEGSSDHESSNDVTQNDEACTHSNKNAISECYDDSIVPESFSALEQSRLLMRQIGSEVIIQQATAVTERLHEVQAKNGLLLQNSNKKRKLCAWGGSSSMPQRNFGENVKNDEDPTPTTTTSTSPRSSSTISELDRVSILLQASRMKRMSLLFQDLDRVYSMLLNELSSVMHDDTIQQGSMNQQQR